MKLTHIGLGTPTGCIHEVGRAMEEFGFRISHKSGSGIMLKPTGNNEECLRLEITDHGPQAIKWNVKEGVLIIYSDNPSELSPVLAELGFSTLDTGKTLYQHDIFPGTPQIKLAEGPSTDWHIGIHFDSLPKLVDFRKQHPLITKIAGEKMSKARGHIHRCVASNPFHGLVIEVTCGPRYIINHDPAPPDLAPAKIRGLSPYTKHGV